MSASSDDIKDLRYGSGKLFKRIASAIDQLKDNGAIAENAQPVIAIVKEKSRTAW